MRPLKAYAPDVGSEGIVAWLVSQVRRLRRTKVLLNPGPNLIRKHKVRRFILVTDFIGSGRRVETYLSSAWRVASVKSWWSRKLLNFEVAAYSSTPSGRARVEAHPVRPLVTIVKACPTLETAFTGATLAAVEKLCLDYDPMGKDMEESRGYGGVGSLLVFGHGCPNNAPRLLHSRGPAWSQLFPERIATRSVSSFHERRDVSGASDRLERLRQRRLAQGAWNLHSSETGRSLVLLLASLGRGPRDDDTISRRSGFSLDEVATYLAFAHRFAWIDERRLLTTDGQNLLEHARRWVERRPTLPPERTDGYYPRQLRVPR